MPSSAPDPGSASIGLPLWLDLILLAAVLTIVVAVVKGLVAWRRSRLGFVPSTAWATASLVVMRVVLAYVLVMFVIIAVPGIGGHTSWGVGDGVVTLDGERMSVSAEASDAVALCPNAMVRGPQNALVPMQTGCGASTAVERATPPGARVGNIGLVVEVEHPSSGERVRGLAVGIVDLLVVFVGVLALERILARTVRREPFALQNVWWLRVLAITVVVGGFVTKLFANHLADDLIRKYGTGAERVGVVHRAVETNASVEPLVVAILILVLAEIWRFGIRLQDDVEATV